MADKFVSLVAGVPHEKEATTTSAGAADAGKIIALNLQGDIDESMLPTGIGADTASILASESLVAGDFVNIFNDAGVASVRKADASTSGKHAHGFVLASVSSGEMATVYFEGENNQISGATPGDVFLSATTPGGFTSTAPSGSGRVVQRLGVAFSDTAINVECGQRYVLA